MSKIITDEQELNTATGDLVTEDYALEILGLKSIADFRKFSRSFMRLSKIVKGIETNVDDNLDEKLNKGAVSSEYDTAKKIEDKIKEAKKAGDTAKTEADNKLDKGAVSEKYNTAEKIGNEIDLKQNKEDSTLKTVVKTIVGAINELYDELIKKATKTQLGRIKVGNNLKVDEDGTLHGNPSYTHPSGNGNKHIPVNGASGNFLKWLSSGAAQWANITWNDITGKPSSFPPSTHTHDDRYYTESEINEKFKNFCPYGIGDIYITTKAGNPSSTWLGTTWQKIEGRFLLGTSGSGASKATGGSNSKTIAQANLPNVKLTVNSFSVTSKDTFIESLRGVLGSPSSSRGPISMPKIGENNTKLRTGASNGSDEGIFIKQNQSSEISGTVSPQTSALGSGSALNITPAYYTCHMWLRLT